MDRWNVFASWKASFNICLREWLEIHENCGKANDCQQGSDEEVLLLWAVLMVRIADRMQFEFFEPETVHHRSVLDFLMGRLGLQTKFQLRELCTSLLWSDAAMLPGLSEVLGDSYATAVESLPPG
jgi:hypothetical protein